MYKVPKRNTHTLNTIAWIPIHNEVDIVRSKNISDSDLKDKYEVVKKCRHFTGKLLYKNKILFRGRYDQCFEYAYTHGFLIGAY